jgi:hypothetical protein
VFELAQLTQIKTVYNVGETLSLRDPPVQIQGSFTDPTCMFSDILQLPQPAY